MTRGGRPLAAAITFLVVAIPPLRASPETAALFPVQKDGKRGYIDRAGRTVIEAKFERAERFSEGLAAVVLDGRHGYIDGSGAMVLVPPGNPAGEVHRPFRDGLAAVRTRSGIGFLDRAGKLVIPARFSSAEDFSEGLAFACDRLGCGYIDRAGRGVFGPGLLGGAPFRDGIAAVWVGKSDMGGKRYVLYQRKRGRLTGDWENAGSFSDGLIAVRTQGRWGYVDREGRGVIRPQFAGAGEFAEGLAPVAEQAWTCGYADASGKLVIPARFRLCYSFVAGRARVEMLGPDPKHPEAAFIDRTGRVVIEGATATPPFETAEDFADGLAAVEAPGTSGGTRRGYIDTDGRYVWPLTE
ncbi:MAG: WG repeat-containing protein [Myxococcales bacterium]